MVKSLSNMVFGGEGFIMQWVTGPGKVQTMNVAHLAALLTIGTSK